MNQGYFLELTSKDSEIFEQFLQKKLENLTSDKDKRDIHRRNTLKDNQRYSSPYLVTDTQRMEAVVEKPYILVTDKKVSSIKEIL